MSGERVGPEKLISHVTGQLLLATLGAGKAIERVEVSPYGYKELRQYMDSGKTEALELTESERFTVIGVPIRVDHQLSRNEFDYEIICESDREGAA